MFDDPMEMLFDNLCGCGNPDCPVNATAQLAKRLYKGEALTAEENRELAEGVVGIIMASKFISASNRVLRQRRSYFSEN